MNHPCPMCHTGTISTTTHMSPETDGTHHWYILEAAITHQSCPCSLTDQQEYAILDAACNDETDTSDLDAWTDQTYDRQIDRELVRD